ncbi:MAG: hypothetical protein KDH17_06860 [Rhodocyclaceae bacterium]|nr:hypothetical protein [Rhodocyclaceae bacterium]MCP5233642.1 hypothetical protein [Zoogloeaceae bacterium]
MQDSTHFPNRRARRQLAQKRLATVAQAAQQYDGVFTESAIRDMIFKAEDRFNSRGDRIPGNGMAEAGVILRIGRKVILDLDAFDAWLDSRKVGA